MQDFQVFIGNKKTEGVLSGLAAEMILLCKP